MNSFLRLAVVRPFGLCLCSLALGLGTSCSGGSKEAAEVKPPPSGYVLSYTKMDARTVDYRLVRTADEPLLGLSFDLVFPDVFVGIVPVGETPGALLAQGTVAVGVDDASPRRVLVTAGRSGGDALRGDGELLTFRLVFGSDVLTDVSPTVENPRFFRRSPVGEFATEVDASMPLTVSAAP